MRLPAVRRGGVVTREELLAAVLAEQAPFIEDERNEPLDIIILAPGLYWYDARPWTSRNAYADEMFDRRAA